MGTGKHLGAAAGLIAAAMSCLPPMSAAIAATPQPAFTATMSSSAAGALSVRLDAAPSGDAEGEIILYQWVFGDGATGSGQVVVHTYPSPGTYPMTLFIADDQGETALITEQVTVPIPIEPSAERLAPISGPAALVSPEMVGPPTGIAVGQLAPEFALTAITGERFALSEVRGSVVVLDFWSSGCGACQATMPGLVSIQQQLSLENVLFVGISLDQDAASAQRYIARYGFRGITLWQSASANRSVMARYGVSSVPTTLVIDTAGVIRFRGYRSELDAQIIENVVPIGSESADQDRD